MTNTYKTALPNRHKIIISQIEIKTKSYEGPPSVIGEMELWSTPPRAPQMK